MHGAGGMTSKADQARLDVIHRMQCIACQFSDAAFFAVVSKRITLWMADTESTPAATNRRCRWVNGITEASRSPPRGPSRK